VGNSHATRCRTGRLLQQGLSLEKLQLHAHVGAFKAQVVVKAVRIGALAIGGQLHKAAMLVPGPGDNPLEKLLTNLLPSKITTNANGLD
jgi:hypothetical protein